MYGSCLSASPFTGNLLEFSLVNLFKLSKTMEQGTLRQLATIAQVSELIPIKGADRIVLARFVEREWEVIVGKDVVSVGTLGVYYEPDSFLPVREEYEELRKSCFRTGAVEGQSGFYVRTIKMRGVYSQGYFKPLTDLPQSQELAQLALHMDVTELLGVTQWPETMDDEPGQSNFKPFPNYLPKTTLKRVENITKIYQTQVEKSQTFILTEKLDGTSCTVFLNKKGEFHVCSRNFDVTGNDDVYNQIAKAYSLKSVLETYGKPLAIQGEIIGPKIQKNHYELKTLAFRVFRFWDLDLQCPLPLVETAKQLGLETVPILVQNFILPAKPGLLRNQVEEGCSALANGKIREGFVLSAWPFDESQTSFKVISRKYLSKSN